jgi:hypothetical protein
MSDYDCLAVTWLEVKGDPWVLTVHSTYANILKNRYKKVRKDVGIG